MARTDHSKINRHVSKTRGREARVRQELSRVIALGDYDTLPSRLPTRAMRTRRH